MTTHNFNARIKQVAPVLGIRETRVIIGDFICPGRAISVERDVLGPLREMGPCYAMGHAAGLASVQVVREGKSYKNVDTNRLRNDLQNAGAVVDWHE
jgi:hypothetical protein